MSANDASWPERNFSEGGKKPSVNASSAGSKGNPPTTSSVPDSDIVSGPVPSRPRSTP